MHILPWNNKRKGFLKNNRYYKIPIKLFYEFYVLDLIGHLPEDSRKTMEWFNIQPIFQTKSKLWKDVVREYFHITDVADKKILELWKKNQQKGGEDRKKMRPIDFARTMADSFDEDL